MYDFKGTKSIQEGVKPLVRLVTLNSEYVTGKFLKEGGICFGRVEYIANKMKNEVIYF